MPLGFNRTFKLYLPILANALQAFSNKPGLKDHELANSIGINLEKAIGYSRWMLACGLRNTRDRTLTDLGSLLANKDPYLLNHGTKYVLHFQLASNRYSEVWWYLIDYISKQKEIKIGKAVDLLLQDGIGVNNQKHLVTDIRVFVSAYIDQECFAPINVITISEKDTLIPVGSYDLHPLILGYALYCQREKGLPVTTNTISTLLVESGNVGRVFFLDRAQLVTNLQQLEFKGIVKTSSLADLDNIAYTYDGSAIELLNLYFEEIK